MGTQNEKKRSKKVGKIIRTIFSTILVIVTVVVMTLANTVLAENNRMVDMILGDVNKRIDNSKVDATGLDLVYNKSNYTKEEIGDAEQDLKQRISQEGIVLLKNEKDYLPLASETTFSLFSVNSTKLSIGGGLLGGGSNLKEIFEKKEVAINETLWNFYAKEGKDYGLASGSISFGDAEDFAINEAPLSLLMANKEVTESLKGTTPIYVLKRVAGEGRDMPRSMYNHTDKAEDKIKSYLELDSVELEILSYLNDNFDNSILVVNSNAALELGFLADYPNITSVLYAPDGLLALPDVLSGKVNPSGRTVDTFATHALASPAAQNFGDYAYYNADGTPTKYNYVSYAEGIYVGYRYYETRYEDVVLGQGNAGEYDYKKEVCYPFGYGLSYTTFAWDNLETVWNETSCTVTVDVTNTGKVEGKDVVEIYVQSPYTDYDKANKVEKPSAQLVGYDKTKILKPQETQKISITFEEEQLKSYDYSKEKTYILDAGTYYITAGKDAHDAVNNILTAKKIGQPDKMTAKGNSDMVSTYEPKNQETDVNSYAKDTYSGVEITNQFDEALGDVAYLSRSDWQGTWPIQDGEVYGDISTWGNEINGTDTEGEPASYVYGKVIEADLLTKLEAFDSLSPVDAESIESEMVYGKKNGLKLIQMRGLDYEDPLWEDLLDQLTPKDYFTMITESGYGTPFIESINKPFCVDADTASGLIYGGTGTMFPNKMTLAQTWNKALALEFGEIIGSAAVLGGADGWYAPSLNMHRTPFSGRNGEYYSEDPYLSGRVAANEVYGVASKGVYAYIKHFAFNDQENHRGDRAGQFSMATWMNEQAAREIYLFPFEMCMKVGDVELNYLKQNEDGSYENAVRPIRACQAVMTAFNRIGYTWTGASYPLITGILRNEWDFKGFVLTDNANTGVFMDGYQMIEAGADAKLTYAKESARFDYDENDKATYYYGREAMKRMLYTIANSKAMNGAMPGSIFINATTLSQKIILGVNIIGPIIILVMVGLTILRFRKKKDDVVIEKA